MRFLSAALLLAPALLAAQGAPAKPVANVKTPAAAGWQTQNDKVSMPKDFAFAKLGTGFHATTGTAAGIAYDASMTATAPYRFEGAFTQTKAPMHPEAYGLIFGGKDLGSDHAEYFYFVVRGDGKYLVKHHAPNGDVHTISDWKASDALKVADASGKATNTLRVEVGTDSTKFFANGAQLAALPLSGSGVVGVRVNHMLDVHIDGLKLTHGK